MVRFGVTPRKETELRERMDACGLREEDLDESFVTSGGPGGQKVNRSATCVRLVHRPTGIEVKMQQARSQSLNRFYARRRLCELIEMRRSGESSPVSKEQARIRKQKQRRRRRARQMDGEEPLGAGNE